MNLKEIIYIRIIAQLLYHWCYFKSLLFINKKKKLHVGCGKNKFSGWINADVVPSSELIVFLQKKLLFRKKALSRIYTEHVLEHASYEVGLYFMKEAYRVLEIGGVVRLAMPDLDDLIEAYVNDWRRLDWVNWPESAFIKTKGQMINISFRWWGHCLRSSSPGLRFLFWPRCCLARCASALHLSSGRSRSARLSPCLCPIPFSPFPQASILISGSSQRRVRITRNSPSRVARASGLSLHAVGRKPRLLCGSAPTAASGAGPRSP